MTVDLKSVSMHGKFNHSRVRVLWRDGELRAFGVVGPLLELKTLEPVRLQGFSNRWLAESDLGPLILKSKCMTCGGPKWWRIVRKTADELWSSVDG